MNVAELIQQLDAMPRDAIVHVEQLDDPEGAYDVREIERYESEGLVVIRP